MILSGPFELCHLVAEPAEIFGVAARKLEVIEQLVGFPRHFIQRGGIVPWLASCPDQLRLSQT